jgi:ABC-type sulfate transport system permease component
MPLTIYLGSERGFGVAIVLSGTLVVVSIVLLGEMQRLEKRSRADTKDA